MTRPRQTICVIATAQLSAHPDNIRDDLGDLEDMARSVREHGILQPLTVTEHPGATIDGPVGPLPVFRILDGHRRFRAALLAHETKVPAIIRHDLVDETEHTVIMLVTGVHRRELSAVERAKGYGRLHDAGLKPSTVSYYLNLLRLDETTLEKVEAGAIPVTEAIAEVRAGRKSDRVAGGLPTRGRPAGHFSPSHPLAPVVADRCTHVNTYGGIGCGPCWEKAIREDALAVAKDRSVAS